MAVAAGPFTIGKVGAAERATEFVTKVLVAFVSCQRMVGSAGADFTNGMCSVG